MYHVVVVKCISFASDSSTAKRLKVTFRSLSLLSVLGRVSCGTVILLHLFLVHGLFYLLSKLSILLLLRLGIIVTTLGYLIFTFLAHGNVIIISDRFSFLLLSLTILVDLLLIFAAFINSSGYLYDLVIVLFLLGFPVINLILSLFLTVDLHVVLSCLFAIFFCMLGIALSFHFSWLIVITLNCVLFLSIFFYVLLCVIIIGLISICSLFLLILLLLPLIVVSRLLFILLFS